jgi:hypothetical protein
MKAMIASIDQECIEMEVKVLVFLLLKDARKSVASSSRSLTGCN